MKAPTPLERRMFSYKAAAFYLGISERGVKQLAADGAFVKVPIGGRVLFDKADLDAYIDRIKESA